MKIPKMKKRLLFISLIVFILSVILSGFLYFQHTKSSRSELVDFDSFHCARFDYLSDTGIESKTIVFQITPLTNFFQSLEFAETDVPFDEDWIFRIIFNWNGILINGKEVVVLIGDSHIKIGDTNYVVIGGDFSDLLATIHNLFDYLSDEALGYHAY